MDEFPQNIFSPGQQVLGALAGRLPTIITLEGGLASRRFVEFFVANIHNRNTREAYARAAWRTLDCYRDTRIAFGQLEPILVFLCIEQLGRELAHPSTKQHLTALRMLFDWLVTGHVVLHNPTAAVRGPKHIVRKRKLLVGSAALMCDLIDSITAFPHPVFRFATSAESR